MYLRSIAWRPAICSFAALARPRVPEALNASGAMPVAVRRGHSYRQAFDACQAFRQVESR